ncbi:unnamed protein product, partial [Soboliphyme baturini]|uniref:Uncharacterized protein n=1 Tax=Soboliphyme baturini TaxID=241478 RepID=A0A183J8Q6_9BILA
MPLQPNCCLEVPVSANCDQMADLSGVLAGIIPFSSNESKIAQIQVPPKHYSAEFKICHVALMNANHTDEIMSSALSRMHLDRKRGGPICQNDRRISHLASDAATGVTPFPSGYQYASKEASTDIRENPHVGEMTCVSHQEIPVCQSDCQMAHLESGPATGATQGLNNYQNADEETAFGIGENPHMRGMPCVFHQEIPVCQSDCQMAHLESGPATGATQCLNNYQKADEETAFGIGENPHMRGMPCVFH